MDLTPIMQWLESTPVAQQIMTSEFLFPALESIHVIGVVLVFGTILIVDARLLGIGSKGQPLTQVMEASLRWTWIGFLTALVTGSLMFVSSATTYITNGPFQFKMATLALAGINMLVFESILVKDVRAWDESGLTPVAARVSGGLSILFWISIVALGRWIGFTKISGL